MFKHILIPTDGSKLSGRAASAGLQLAAALGARVTAYHAVRELDPVFTEGYSFDRKVIADLEKRAREVGQRRVEAIAALAKAAGVPCTVLVTKAPALHEGIVAAAKQRKCDAIFMATHGRRGISKLLLGSVTQKVLAHAGVPVVVYR